MLQSKTSLVLGLFSILLCGNSLADQPSFLDKPVNEIRAAGLVPWIGDIYIETNVKREVTSKDVVNHYLVRLEVGKRCVMGFMPAEDTNDINSTQFKKKISRGSTFRLRSTYRDSGYLSDEYHLIFNRLPFARTVSHLWITCTDQLGEKSASELTLREIMNDLGVSETNGWFSFQKI